MADEPVSLVDEAVFRPVRSGNSLEDTVARLMRRAGIAAKTARRFRHTTDSNHDRPVADNRLELVPEGARRHRQRGRTKARPRASHKCVAHTE
mgnify:CR=1 FL=1